jgi:hypothetical protein|tara:strand:- start:99 stop:269 length:171 start_codon:yes stop_codon:yes gene_type:complete
VLYNNDKEWQETSDGWVKAMHESRERKEKLNEECNHPIEEWCDTCKYTIDGEELDI